MKLNEERRTEIINLLKMGLSNSEIRRRTNTSWETIDRIREECGFGKRKDPKDSDFTKEQIAQWDYLHERYGGGK